MNGSKAAAKLSATRTGARYPTRFSCLELVPLTRVFTALEMAFLRSAQDFYPFRARSLNYVPKISVAR